MPLLRFRPGSDPFADCAEIAPGVYVHRTAQVDSRLSAPALIHAGARIEAGAILGSGVVVGAGARIDTGAQVERAVVWPGTHVATGERVIDQIAAPGVRLDC